MKGEHNKLKRIIIGLGFLLVFIGLSIYAYIQISPETNTINNNITQDNVQENNTTQFNIEVTTDNSKGHVTGTGTYDEHSNNTLTATPSDGYQFIGWYNENTLLSNECSYTINNLQQNYNITARFEKINTINYILDQETYNPNPTTYTIADNEITLLDLAKPGYQFNGWYTEANGNGTKIIKLSTSTETDYTIYSYFTIISYTIDYILDCTVPNPNPTTYTIEDENITLINLENTGYTFHGWFTDANGGGERITIINTQTPTNYTIYSHFIINTYNISYNYTHDYQLQNPQNEPLNPNPITYTITDGNIVLIDLEKPGYTFDGWYTSSTGMGTKITTINTSSLTNYSLYYRFTLTTYTINYIMNGGSCTIPNPTQYTILSSDITLHNPTKTDSNFIGWTSNITSTPTLTMTIPSGSYGNLIFTANFESLNNSVYFYADNQLLESNTIVLPYNQVTYAPTINASEYGMTGYIIETWYTDNTYTQEYEFGNTISTDTSIFGKWTYFIDYGFYRYYEKFSHATTTTPLNINSYNELVAWVDWINYYNITSTYRIQLNYSYTPHTTNGLLTQLNNAKSASIFPIKYTSLNATAESSSIGYFRHNADNTNKECTKIADQSHSYVYDQLTPAFASQLHNQRSSEYNDFNINNVQKTITATTSDQLFYALETGFKPSCTNNSPAETLYNTAKTILRDICNDTMTDIEKAYAIYSWLVCEVDYDYYAASNSFPYASSWPEYDSWYADGALISKEAVCDGISKAFVILAEIENIPAIRVTGNQHAWNRVYIDGSWYGLDATHGGGGIQDTQQEIFSISQFLFTDTFKTSISYTSSDFSTIVADTIYDFYEDYDKVYGTNFDLCFDLCIDTQNEFNALCEYLYNKYYDGSHLTIEIFEIELNNTEIDIYQLLSSANNYILLHHFKQLFSSYTLYSQTTVSGITTYLILPH